MDRPRLAGAYLWVSPVCSLRHQPRHAPSPTTRSQPSQQAEAVPPQAPAVDAAFRDTLIAQVRQITRLPLQEGNVIRLLRER